jgi:uncharacterized membrane protein (DUF485 family)
MQMLCWVPSLALNPPSLANKINNHTKEFNMLYGLVIVLLVLWALGFFAFPVAGGLIHILLVIAVIVIVYQFVTGRRSV